MKVVLAKIIDGFPQVLECVVRPAGGVGLGAFASAQQHEEFDAKLCAKVHRAHGLLHGIGTHLAISFISGKTKMGSGRSLVSSASTTKL